MAESNGSGRMDRIEAAQERDHAENQREFKQLMTWQVLMQEKMDRWDRNWERMQATQEAEQKRLNALSESTDKRIGELVSAIGKQIERLPAPGSR